MLLLLKDHLVFDTAQLLNLDLNNIAILEPLWLLHTHGNTRRCARHDDGASLESGTLANESNNLLSAKKEIVGVGVLSYLAVDNGLKLEVAGVTNNLGGDKQRADGGELVEALAEAPLWDTAGEGGVTLPFSNRNIVSNDETSNVLKSLLLGDVLASLADDDGQLTLVVELVILGKFWDGDILLVACDGSAWLDENGRVWRRLAATFLNC